MTLKIINPVPARVGASRCVRAGLLLMLVFQHP
jgi:hypothetical protein